MLYIHSGTRTCYVLATVDRENYVVKKVMWDKSSTCFNFIKAESIVCMSTKNYVSKNFREF